MDIPHIFEVYQEQLANIRKNNYYGRPHVLGQVHEQYKGFTEADIELLKSYLLDNDKKWFVAHLLDNVEIYPVELLEPMLIAAVKEPDPSFNNEFIKPCRRAFDYVDIQNILLHIFRNGTTDKKIGVLKALYWVRRTVYTLTIRNGENGYQHKGHDIFFWDPELKTFNEDFEEDEVFFDKEVKRQEAAYKEQVRTIIEEYYRTNDRELKYQIALRLPKEAKEYPKELQEQATVFLRDIEHEGIPKGNITLKQR